MFVKENPNRKKKKKRSTWPNIDSSLVIMGDDSSKNNNQIYCLIKFSVFALSQKNNKQNNK